MAGAAAFLNYEEDLRAVHTIDSGLSGGVAALGGAIRLVIPDRKGDRLILYTQAELAGNFSGRMLHQAYAQLKGPMGVWNAAVGRVPLPWGLLTGWSPDRLPYHSPYRFFTQNSSDNGLRLSGVWGALDYGLAFTQGFGMGALRSWPGPGIATGRVGITPGTGDVVVGVSASAGRFYPGHRGHENGTMALAGNAGALDITAYLGQALIRAEGAGRYDRNHMQSSIFVSAEYLLFPKLTIIGAGQIYTQGSGHHFGWLWAGLAAPLKSVTIRGGYTYEKSLATTHRIGIQLHRLFAISR
jgi:hypothetical protein